MRAPRSIFLDWSVRTKAEQSIVSLEMSDPLISFSSSGRLVLGSSEISVIFPLGFQRSHILSGIISHSFRVPGLMSELRCPRISRQGLEPQRPSHHCNIYLCPPLTCKAFSLRPSLTTNCYWVSSMCVVLVRQQLTDCGIEKTTHLRY